MAGPFSVLPSPTVSPGTTSGTEDDADGLGDLRCRFAEVCGRSPVCDCRFTLDFPIRLDSDCVFVGRPLPICSPVRDDIFAGADDSEIGAGEFCTPVNRERGATGLTDWICAGRRARGGGTECVDGSVDNGVNTGNGGER